MTCAPPANLDRATLEFAIATIRTREAQLQAQIDNGQCKNRFQEYEAQAIISTLCGICANLRLAMPAEANAHERAESRADFMQGAAR